MDADAELDAAIFRHSRVALDHAALQFNRAAHRVDDAASIRDESVARALDDPPAMHRDRRIDQIATQRAQPRRRSLLIGAGEHQQQPTTSATRIAAIFRISDMVRPHASCR